MWGPTHYRVSEKNIADVVAREIMRMTMEYDRIVFKIELIDEDSEEEKELRRWKEENDYDIR